MLTRLTIHNYVLIDSLEVEFEPGFSVITGETGAGKSIIMGALQLILGARADAKVIRPGAQQCRIEAEFGDRIMTRTFSANGKSRCFIDDEPATVAELREMGSMLIDIHSQHENLLLKSSGFQLSVIDTIARSPIDDYRLAYREWKETRERLETLRSEYEATEREHDFMQFQYEQIAEARLRENEEVELEDERKALAHATDTVQLLSEAASLTDNDESGAVNLLRSVAAKLHSAATMNPRLNDLAERAESAYIDIKDFAGELADRTSDIVVDPERLAMVEERLDTINTILHKHHVNDTKELLALFADLEEKLNSFSNIAEQISAVENELAQKEKELHVIAKRLTASRKAVTATITDSIHATLAKLGMPNARFDIRITPLDAPRENGADEVEFLMSTNSGTAFCSLSSLSGGEAARVMLAVKSLLTGSVQLPTIIFDEIDTGVSGRIAEAMGSIMADMGAADRQVISITHLPQIAARGAHHYRVFKDDDKTQSQTDIELLSEEERLREIASMLSGETLTEEALGNARALLNNTAR